MEANKYSETLKIYKQSIGNPQLVDDLNNLKANLNLRSLKLLIWDDNRIAIPLTISIELPPLGNFNGIDIQTKEPIILVVNVSEYPYTPPKVFPDRLDFPKDKLAHLYVAVDNKPPAFCLVRGDMSEWFSNKLLLDIIIRTQNWFRDAVSGELLLNGGQFDPVRLEGYSGTLIYDYDIVVELISKKKPFLPSLNFAIGYFERKLVDERFSFTLVKILSPQNLEEVLADFTKEKEKDATLPSKKHFHFGYIIWTESEESISYDNYFVNLPRDWDGFKAFCADFGISTSNLEKFIAKYDLNSYQAIPVIVAVKRPLQVIGFSNNIEFFNFYLNVNTPDVSEEKIINNIPVSFLQHNQSLSIFKAKQISGFTLNSKKFSLIIGCGALGSKIVMHFARSGTTRLLLSDPDTFSPHNLVRHSLYTDSEGISKSKALQAEIKKMFPSDSSYVLATVKRFETIASNETLNMCENIFDFSASSSVQQFLSSSKEIHGIKVIKAYLSDHGNLGILLIEGENRNPRIDDLQILLYSKYNEFEEVSNWLQREAAQNRSDLIITIGIGCNSETVILSDDIVSLHASFFSGTIKQNSEKSLSSTGEVFLNTIAYEPFFHNKAIVLEFKKLFVIKAVNDSSWEIRIKHGLIESIKMQMGLNMPDETGGIFVGCADYKTKCIHVTDLITAPPDSTSNPVCFFRGVEGLPEKIKEINVNSGSQLGYIGEWHSHPFGPDSLSRKDFTTAKMFKQEFSKLPNPIPVFLLIITPNNLIPYVF